MEHKSAGQKNQRGVLKPFGRIALIFLDFLVRFAPTRHRRVKAKGQIRISLCSIEFVFFYALF
jgi:hypothetical protein